MRGGRQRPFVKALFDFPALNHRGFDTPLLVDTGADRTVLAPRDARRFELELGIALTTLSRGLPSTGVGGQMGTRTVEAVITLDGFSASLTLTILEPPAGPLSAIPSLLGRDILSRFALFVEQRTDRVLLLEPHEAAALNLP